jgi:hypothetical protein
MAMTFPISNSLLTLLGKSLAHAYWRYQTFLVSQSATSE